MVTGPTRQVSKECNPMLQALRERLFHQKEATDIDIATFAAQWLTPRLRKTLASLHGTPDEVVEGVIQLLPIGSRTALTKTDPALAVEVERRSGRRYLELTPFGRDVIAFLASHDELVSDLV